MLILTSRLWRHDVIFFGRLYDGFVGKSYLGKVKEFFNLLPFKSYKQKSKSWVISPLYPIRVNKNYYLGGYIEARSTICVSFSYFSGYLHSNKHMTTLSMSQVTLYVNLAWPRRTMSCVKVTLLFYVYLSWGGHESRSRCQQWFLQIIRYQGITDNRKQSKWLLPRRAVEITARRLFR